MPSNYDVIVVGLGVTGSSAAVALARRGARVLGLDRWTPPHAWGSSHGDTRISREAYYERPIYVPLVRRARELWEELEREAGGRLHVETGGLNIGLEGSELVIGALASAREHGVEHEVLTAAEVRRRYPGLRLAEGNVAVLEPRAGVLFPEACVAALHDRARWVGARIEYENRVEGWKSGVDGIEVTTERGRRHAGRLVLAAGPWLSALVPGLGLPLEVERQWTAWFGHDGSYVAADFPVTLWEFSTGAFLYSCPDVGFGLKVGYHHGGRVVDPERVDREVDLAELESLRAAVSELFPRVSGGAERARVCLYTNTPDHDFIVDLQPGDPRVVIASPCSGHGFKFGPALGEVVADLVLAGGTSFDVRPFRLDRFARLGVQESSR
ncbi:MAG: N-methyl-L-tryptophan oxidase [Longimicrobiales bacterium]